MECENEIIIKYDESRTSNRLIIDTNLRVKLLKTKSNNKISRYIWPGVFTKCGGLNLQEFKIIKYSYVLYL